MDLNFRKLHGHCDAPPPAGAPLGQSERVGVALAAGATSALISCPAEMIMIQQQVHCTPLPVAFRDFVAQYGLLKVYRGLVRTTPYPNVATPPPLPPLPHSWQSVTMLREGVYTAGYQGICPMLLTRPPPLPFPPLPPS